MDPSDIRIDSDIFVYKGTYSIKEWDDNLQPIVDKLVRYDFSRKDGLILLNSKDDEYNKWLLHFLCVLKHKEKLRSLVILCDRDISDFIRKESTSSFHFIQCSSIELYFLSRMTAIYPWRYVYKTGFEQCLDVDVSILEKLKRISVKEIVSIGILGLGGVPSEEAISELGTEATEELPHWEANPAEKYIRYRSSMYNDENEYYDACADIVKGNINVSKTDRLIMFGVMKTSICFMDRLNDYCFVGFADNDKNKTGMRVKDLPVVLPEKIRDSFGKDVKIIVTSKYTYEIVEQLMTLGFELDKEIIIAYEKYDVQRELFVHPGEALYEITASGRELYGGIRNRFHEETIVHLPYAGTGDVFLAAMYIKEICREHDIKKNIFVVASNGCGKVLEAFGESYIILEQDRSIELINYARFVGFDEANYIVLNDSFGQNVAVRLRAWGGVDFHTMFARCVFRVNKDLKYPVNMKQENSEDIFENAGLRMGKTVVLSPYAKTVFLFPQDEAVKGIDEMIWEDMVHRFRVLGFDVCTNISSKEKPIKGTVGVFIPYSKVIDFVNKAGFFVGVRSGLCDIIASSTAEKCIIYTINHAVTGDIEHYNYRYFSLERMGISDENLFETEIDQDTVNNLPVLIEEHLKEKVLGGRK